MLIPHYFYLYIYEYVFLNFTFLYFIHLKKRYCSMILYNEFSLQIEDNLLS